MFNCPGWSQSGGPWIQPEQSLRRLTFSETARVGSFQIHARNSRAREACFRTSQSSPFQRLCGTRTRLRVARSGSPPTPRAEGLEKLMDGKLSTTAEFPPGAGRGNTPFIVEVELDEPFTARSLQLFPSEDPFAADCELQVAADDGNYQSRRQFKIERSNMSPGVGFMPRGPVSISFPAATAKRFRLVFTNVHGGAARGWRYFFCRGRGLKRSSRNNWHDASTPLPMWDTYLWRPKPQPEDPKLSFANAVRDCGAMAVMARCAGTCLQANGSFSASG